MKNQLIKTICLFAAASSVAMADAPPQLTPEQQQAIVQAFIGKLGQAPGPQAAAVAPPAIEQHTDAELASIIATWPAPKSGLKIEGLRDGFTVDGQRVVDPEGRIVKYGWDVVTGNVSYLVQQDEATYLVKTMRAGGGVEPLTIAVAVHNNQLWQVTTATGKRMTGNRITPTSVGILVARDNTGFLYQPGRGLTSFAGPEDFRIASFQAGDVTSTDNVLLERRPPDRRQDGGVGALLGSIKALGSSVGVGTKADYALLNIRTNHVTPLNIAMEDKDVEVAGYGCTQKGRLAMSCEHTEFAERLYDTNGQPNLGHYFWRIRWLKTQARNVVIAQENGLRNVTLTDLDNGTKTVLFDRTLGIAGFRVAADGDGRVNVSAKMGFSTETKSDVVALLDVPAKPADAASN